MPHNRDTLDSFQSNRYVRAVNIFLQTLLIIVLFSGINYLGIDPISALYWAAVLNGVLAPPLLVVILLAANNPAVMGQQRNGVGLNALGWIAVAVMTAAAIALFVT